MRVTTSDVIYNNGGLTPTPSGSKDCTVYRVDAPSMASFRVAVDKNCLDGYLVSGGGYGTVDEYGIVSGPSTVLVDGVQRDAEVNTQIKDQAVSTRTYYADTAYLDRFDASLFPCRYVLFGIAPAGSYYQGPPLDCQYFYSAAANLFGHRTNGSYASDPVNTAIGNYTGTWSDLRFATDAASLTWTRSYNSMDPRVGHLGRGWTDSFDVTLTADADGRVELHQPDGRQITFDPQLAGGYGRPEEFYGNLVANPDLTYKTVMFDGSTWQFDTNGRLASITDAAGHATALTRDGNGALTAASNSTGPSLTFTYSSGLLSTVSASDGRTVSYAYTAGVLSGVTGADGQTTTIGNDGSGRVTQITDPAGRLVVANVYDTAGRVSSQTTPAGGTVTFGYNELTGVTTHTDVASGDVTTYTHDAYGRLTGVTDAAGGELSKTYDDDGNLTSMIDRRSNTAAATFDAHGNVLTSTDQAGKTTTNTYDSIDRLLSTTDAAARSTTYTYAGTDRLPTTITAPGGAVTTNTVTGGRITRTVDADGVTTDLGYDAVGNLTSSTDANHKTWTFGYDAAGRRTSSTSPLGYVTSVVYDAAGRVTSQTDQNNKTTTTTYDAAGNVTKVTDPTGAFTAFAYDSHGSLSSETDPDGNVTTYTYNADGDLLTEQKPGNSPGVFATTTYTYGPLGRLLSVTDPTGIITTFGYDANGNRTTSTDADGKTTTTAYDAKGRVTDVTDPLGHVTHTTYFDDDQVHTVTDPNGAVTTYTYDAAGRTASVEDANHAVATNTYTAAGRPLTVTDALHHTTTYGYDTLGRQTTISDPMNGVTTTGYDDDGRVISKRTPAGRVTTYALDPAGRIVDEHLPNGGTIHRTYTDRGELASMRDGMFGTSNFTYFASGRLHTVADNNGRVTTYSYDGRGNRTVRTAANTTTQKWAFDLADRLTSKIDQLNRTTSYAYDAVGRLAVTTDPTGRTETLTHDAAGRVTRRTYGDGSHVDFTFDNDGRRLTMTDATGTSTNTYDAVGRLAVAATPNGTLTNTYDLGGNRIGLDRLNGTSETYQYDANNRLTTAAGYGNSVTYGYDADGLVTAATLSTGETRTWTRDSGGRVTSYHGAAENSTVNSTMTYDFNDRIVTRTENNVTKTYHYDPVGQLTSTTVGAVTTAAWQYDNIGNRIAQTKAGVTTTYTVDLAHQLLAEKVNGNTVRSYTYDAAGRRLTQSSSAGATTTSYDARGLPSAVITTGPGGVLVNNQQRIYDGNRQLVRQINTLAGNQQLADDKLVWDNAVAVPRLAQTSRNGGAPTEFFYGLDSWRYRAGQNTRPILYDDRGSARVTPNTNGTVAAADYDDYGNPVGVVAPSSLLIGYRGELHDGATLHLRARDYDATTGTFTTTDPLDGVDGTATVADVYSYANHDPLNAVDPLGLRPTDCVLRASPCTLIVDDRVLDRGIAPPVDLGPPSGEEALQGQTFANDGPDPAIAPYASGILTSSQVAAVDVAVLYHVVHQEWHDTGILGIGDWERYNGGWACDHGVPFACQLTGGRGLNDVSLGYTNVQRAAWNSSRTSACGSGADGHSWTDLIDNPGYDIRTTAFFLAVLDCQIMSFVGSRPNQFRVVSPSEVSPNSLTRGFPSGGDLLYKYDQAGDRILSRNALDLFAYHNSFESVVAVLLGTNLTSPSVKNSWLQRQNVAWNEDPHGGNLNDYLAFFGCGNSASPYSC